MLFTCQNRFITLTASHHAQKKRIIFYAGDEAVLDLVVSLDYDRPDYVFPVNVERFMGQTLRVECEPQCEVRFGVTDEPVLDHSGKYRPLAHFTAMRGWMNDPNGLTFHDGRYLMYFQHNPAATTWENMHWGFAESTDLIHWQEHGDVLFPDKYGTMFSGGGLVDTQNLTGLRQGGRDTILCFYTCAGDTSRTSEGQPFTQRLAYSTDGGSTLTKLEEPLIGELAHMNRDPKVVPYEPDGAYIMALYLDGHDFALFRSQDLLHWHELQRLTLPDDAECPDFYPLDADGDPAQRKWVFIAASDRYLIGTFDGHTFTPETEQLRLNYGNASYAAQSWSNTPGRRIRTAFVSQVIPGMPFGCCMDIPQEMTLKTVNGALRLCAWPVPELEKLYTGVTACEGAAVRNGQSLYRTIAGKACDVTVSVRSDAPWSLSLYGLRIAYDPAQRLLACGDRSAPVVGENGVVTLRVVYDTIAAEIFADSGSVFMGMAYIQDSLLNELTIEGTDAEVIQLRIAELKAYYDK